MQSRTGIWWLVGVVCCTLARFLLSDSFGDCNARSEKAHFMADLWLYVVCNIAENVILKKTQKKLASNKCDLKMAAERPFDQFNPSYECSVILK